MGVPAFFRWISLKYPSFVSCCIETDSNTNADGFHDFIDANPNGFEIDNLYLDMNGIIHPCTHPEDKNVPATLEEMFEEIVKYTDRIINITRPRKLIYFAIDGVAPRAKMNQQRSRRFRTARDTNIQKKALAELKKLIKEKGYNVPDRTDSDDFDSNCITPGTEFMRSLSNHLSQYIANSLKSNPSWQDLIVIFSDASVPGEGEHKIMEYIRRQRAKSGYNPNLSHCIYGADADLIMLCLATHEPNFVIIREALKDVNTRKPCPICFRYGHLPSMCKGVDASDTIDSAPLILQVKTEFIFLKINVLREYLSREFVFENSKKQIDFERCIDDWILICFLVGNDFLPHLPSLEIREGAIDRVVNIYKERLPSIQGYLSENGFLNLYNFKLILFDIGLMEDQIFKRRAQRQQSYKERQATLAIADVYRTESEWKRDKLQTIEEKPSLYSSTDKDVRNEPTLPETFSLKRKLGDRVEPTVDDKETDPIRLGEDGWRMRYYCHKFNLSLNELDSFRYQLARDYLLGVSWVLRYYFQGCPSWNWYYPHHYSPFASDFTRIDSLDTNWPTESKPFAPYSQLLAVLPPSSISLIPSCFHSLITSRDSLLVDFYPSSFKVDLNGKFREWQGVALLPFIDEDRLLSCIKESSVLTDHEEKMNETTHNLLFMRETHPLGEYIRENTAMLDVKMTIRVDKMRNIQFFGDIQSSSRAIDILPDTSAAKSPQESPHNKSPIICVQFIDPEFPSDHIFLSKCLEHARIPKPVLKPLDFPTNVPYRSVINYDGERPPPIHINNDSRRYVQRSIPFDRRPPHPTFTDNYTSYRDYKEPPYFNHPSDQRRYDDYNRNSYNPRRYNENRDRDGQWRNNNSRY